MSYNNAWYLIPELENKTNCYLYESKNTLLEFGLMNQRIFTQFEALSTVILSLPNNWSATNRITARP